MRAFAFGDASEPRAVQEDSVELRLGRRGPRRVKEDRARLSRCSVEPSDRALSVRSKPPPPPDPLPARPRDRARRRRAGQGGSSAALERKRFFEIEMLPTAPLGEPEEALAVRQKPKVVVEAKEGLGALF